jgi:hypothetical protein
VIGAAARERIRSLYHEKLGQWGPSVLAEWCRREGLGDWCPTTIAAVIADLREVPAPPPPARRYEITASGVMWSEDGTGFGKGCRKRELLVAQDECARLKVHWRLAKGPARERDVVKYLEDAFRRYGPPLVLKHDGAGIFHGEGMRDLLRRWKVVDLTGPSYWPRYNGRSERSMRDIKSMERALREAGVGSNLRDRIERTMRDLNDERPRPVLGGCIAREVYERDHIGEIDRGAFAKEVRDETRRLHAKARSRNERRAARRHAVEAVLSRHGLLRVVPNVSTNCAA